LVKLRLFRYRRVENILKYIQEGNPADAIIKYAKKIEADIIICGTRGYGGFGALLLGSVAHKLVTYAKIPVLVVK